MKHANNIGFTLIELLGVITLLGIITLIITPAVSDGLKKSKEKVYKTSKDNILFGLKNWASDNKNLLPEKNKDYFIITIGELKQEGFLDYELRNPKTQKCYSNSVELLITKNDKAYDYSFYSDLYDGKETDCGTIAYEPFIYLKGKNPIHIDQYEEYVEPGYTAKNESGADITSNVIVTNNINNTEFGNYVVKYTITNNGISKTKKRTVIVDDKEKPVITGPSTTVIYNSVDNYNILDGMDVTDNSGETINLETVGNLSLGLNGTYYITYFATDSAGNTASFRRKFVIEPAV